MWSTANGIGAFAVGGYSRVLLAQPSGGGLKAGATDNNGSHVDLTSRSDFEARV
jgi:hypothetical protein